MSAADFPLTSERLTLRPYRVEDLEAMHRLMTSLVPSPLSQRPAPALEESWSRLLRHIGHWAQFGYGFLALEDRTSGEFVGEAGFSFFHRELGPELGTSPEATWTIAAEHRNRGYATEAAAAALSWIEQRRGLRRTLCLIQDSNHASLRVADKLGYLELRRVVYQDQASIFFERSADSEPARV